ncbi:MAG: Htaa domain protein, partial [Actinomycetia bacterium]|nr:Htaa domain protein [Actinomycetes bacterium]
QHNPGGPNIPFATLTGLGLVSGTSTNGVWQTAAPVDLEPGNNTMRVEVTDTAGDDVVTLVGRMAPYTVQPRFTGFGFSPANLTVDHVLSYAGRVAYTDHLGAEQPLVGAQVAITESNARSRISAPADANGNVSGAFELDHSTSLVASLYSGDALPVMKTASFPVTVPVAHARIVGLSVTQPQQSYDAAQITGRLERQLADGTWVPFSQGFVTCVPVCEPIAGSTFTKNYPNADGSFLAYSYVQGGGTSWTLSYNPNGEAFDQPTAQLAVPRPQPLVYSTALANVTPGGASVRPGATVHISGQLLYGTDRPVTTPLANATVYLSYGYTDGTYINGQYPNYKGSVTPAQTDANGRFDVAFTAIMTGTWSVNYYGDTHYSYTFGDATGITVVRSTRFANGHITPQPVKRGHPLTLTGALQSLDAYGTWTGIDSAQVTVWFRAKGTTRWVQKTIATVDQQGHYHITVKAPLSGTWQIRFAGDASDDPATSPSTYITAR